MNINVAASKISGVRADVMKLALSSGNCTGVELRWSELHPATIVDSSSNEESREAVISDQPENIADFLL